MKKQPIELMEKMLEENKFEETTTFAYHFDEDAKNTIVVEYKTQLSEKDKYQIVENTVNFVFNKETGEYNPSLKEGIMLYNVIDALTDIDIENLSVTFENQHLQRIAYIILENYNINSVPFSVHDLRILVNEKLNYEIENYMNENSSKLTKLIAEIETQQEAMQNFVKKFKNVDLKKLATTTSELAKKDEKEIVNAIKVYKQNGQVDNLEKAKQTHKKITKK